MDHTVKIALGIIAVAAIVFKVKPRKRPGSHTTPDQQAKASSQAHGPSALPAAAASGDSSTPPGLQDFEPSPGADAHNASQGHSRSTTAGNSASAPTLTKKVGEYDVFISHCGVDTKRNFAVWLKDELENVGLRCFFDDHSLKVGDSAAGKMLEAMETATYGVVILSPGFFEREWCMKELQTFVRRGKVVPIFLPGFEAVEKASKAAVKGRAWTRFKEFVRTKKEFLEATNCSRKFTGFRLSADDGWWNTCIRKARDEILGLLGKEKGGLRISEDELLVGQYEHLVELKGLLGLPQFGVVMGQDPATAPREVGIVGVKGMGGVGKSTMAKKLYDEPAVREHFEGGICWLEVGLNPSNYDVCNLQRQILKQLCNSDEDPGNPTRGRRLIRDRLCGKRVLICLDNVWESFGAERFVVEVEDLEAGSRILKTTRDSKAVGLGGVVHNLDVLPTSLGLELFCWHAFGGKSTPADLAQATEQAASRCGGLPLALKILGKQMLFATNKKAFLENFLKLPKLHDAMRQCGYIIRASYDNLPVDLPGLKEVFVLMAGFWPRTETFFQKQALLENVSAAVYGDEPWQERHDLAENALRHLAEKSLVVVQKQDRQTICTFHDLVADVACKISMEGASADRVYYQQPDGEPSVGRVEKSWQHVQVVQGPVPMRSFTSPKSRVVSLVVDGSACEFQVEARMEREASRCRLLIVIGGRPALVLSGLANLCSLRLTECTFDLLPDGEAIGGLTGLTALDLKRCEALTALPESLGQLARLTALNLSFCKALAALPESLGQLSRLMALGLEGCNALATLPTSLGFLTRLTSLDLAGSLALAVLPESLGQLTGLTGLDLSECEALASVPESLGQLTGLTTLNMTQCHVLAALPNSLGQLTGLTSLDLSKCLSLAALPDSIGQLTALKALSLSQVYCWAPLRESLLQPTELTPLELLKCCALTALPESLGQLTGLTALKLSSCPALAMLPESLGRLTGLTTLKVTCDALKALPESLGQLSRLMVLDLSSCDALAALPDSLGQLTGLMALNLSWSHALTALPESLGQLTGLTALHLSWSHALAALPESLGQLTGLTTLELSSCSALAALPESLGQLTGLTTLELSSCSALAVLPETVGQLTGLTTLELSSCSALAVLPESLGQLTGLAAIHLKTCKALAALPESLGQLTGLKRLDLRGCKVLSPLPKSLRELTGLTTLT